MRSYTRWQMFIAAIAAATVALAASTAGAQSIRVKPGDTVSRIDWTGRQTDGVVLGVGPSALAVQVGGMEQQWTLAETLQLWRDGDSLANGLIIGSLVGLGVGIYGGFALANLAESEESSYLKLTGFFGALAGAGLGTLLDERHRGRTLVYWHPSSKVVIGPLLSRGMRGAQLAFRF